MNKKKALGLLIGIGVTLAAVNMVADRATDILNSASNNNPDTKPDIIATEVLPPVDEQEIVSEEVSQKDVLPDGMVEYTVLVARSRISADEIFTLDNIEAVKQSFPDNTEKSNLLVISEDEPLEDVFERIKGYKPQSPLRPKDIIYVSRVNYDDERVFEEDMTRIWLSLDQRVRFSDKDALTLIHLERSRSATGGEIVKIREALKSIPIITDTDKGGAYLQFTSKNQKEFAQEILDAGGLIEIDMKTTAQVRRLSCGVETCMGTLSQFPELATSRRQSIEETMPPPSQPPVELGTSVLAPLQPSQVQPSQAIPSQAEGSQTEAAPGSITNPAKPLTWAEKASLRRQQELEEANTNN